MWYYDSQIIKTPKAMVISGITHPKGIFRDSTMLTSLGIKPYRETKTRQIDTTGLVLIV